jgi:hypothetical protein
MSPGRARVQPGRAPDPKPLHDTEELHMPTSPTKKSSRKPAKRVAANATDAVATGTKLPMAWQGELFTIDLHEIQFGRSAYAMRQVGNENLPILGRVHAMIDVVECAIGQEQLARIVELTPRLFDDHDTMMAFWSAFNMAVHGASPGESSAS